MHSEKNGKVQQGKDRSWRLWTEMQAGVQFLREDPKE